MPDRSRTWEGGWIHRVNNGRDTYVIRRRVGGHLYVGGDINADAAWYYSSPKDAAKQISGYVAFWRGVTVER